MIIKFNQIISPNNNFAMYNSKKDNKEVIDDLYDEDELYDDFEDENSGKLNLSAIFAAIFACLIALVIGIAIGYMVLPGLFEKNNQQTSAPIETQPIIQTVEPTEEIDNEIVEQEVETAKPTVKPTKAPTKVPTEAPTETPTPKPTPKPTKAPEPTTDADGNRIHVVKAGDNLYTISIKYYGKYLEKLLLDANPGLQPTKMKVGDKVILPPEE